MVTKLISVVVVSAITFVVGMSPEIAVFAKSDIPAVNLEQKMNKNPSSKLESHTEPLMASVAIIPQPKIIPTPVSNKDIIWNRLITEGFSAEQTAGIMGNLQQEHNFNTSLEPGGLGIAQWTNNRMDNLLAKNNPYDINTQLDFLMEELNGGYSNVKQLILQSDLYGSTINFQNHFERCGICMESNRLQYARSILDIYTKK